MACQCVLGVDSYRKIKVWKNIYWILKNAKTFHAYIFQLVLGVNLGLPVGVPTHGRAGWGYWDMIL